MSWQVNRKNAEPKALLIHPDGIDVMNNLMKVAQALGQKALHTDDPIYVYPWNDRFEDRRGVKWFLVIVEKMECTNNQVQGKDVV